jgi:hypothetical protein
VFQKEDCLMEAEVIRKRLAAIDIQLERASKEGVGFHYAIEMLKSDTSLRAGAYMTTAKKVKHDNDQKVMVLQRVRKMFLQALEKELEKATAELQKTNAETTTN